MGSGAGRAVVHADDARVEVVHRAALPVRASGECRTTRDDSA